MVGLANDATGGLLLADIGISAGIAVIDSLVASLVSNGPHIAGAVAGTAFCVAMLALMIVQGAER